MLQYSVYARVCNGNDAVTKHRARLTGQLPANGAVRLLVVTEKQYQSIEILLGPFSPADTPFACEQLTLFYFSERTKSASGRSLKRFLQQSIIPYQELLGNYNGFPIKLSRAFIIPYQELLGNYNRLRKVSFKGLIIPYQELLGNYNL